MDRPIPDNASLSPSLTRELADIKIKQGMQKEAFESALQRADERRNMGDRDRVVSAELKHAQSSNTSLQASAHHEKVHLVPECALAQSTAGVAVRPHSSSVVETQTTNTASLSDESVGLLLKNLQTNQCALGDSIELELLNDPSGVAVVKLTKDSNNGWSINLLLKSDTSQTSEGIDKLSQKLAEQIRQAGYEVNDMVVSINLAPHTNVVS